MQTKTITEDFTVAAQITPDDVPAIAAEGYRSILCNRPDGEEPGQPPFGTIAAAAEAQGLRVAYLPVVSGQITPENVEDFRAAMQDLPGPVFAYCRSGARCQNLWMLAR
jgi:uncharacterized protein (TIGR01244 family)